MLDEKIALRERIDQSFLLDGFAPRQGACITGSGLDLSI
jgi:hypothetical protein